MQVSRFLRASVFIAAVTLAVPALAFGGHGGGGGGHGGGFGGGGFHGGGFGGGGFHGGGGGWHGGGGGGWHGGGSWRGAGWHGGYGGWGYPAYGYGYPYGFDDGYDWGYDYGDPGYDYGYDNGYGDGPGVYGQEGDGQNPGAYTPPPQVNGQLGQYCRTQVKICQLHHASNVGAGCSCRTGASRAYGQVTP